MSIELSAEYKGYTVKWDDYSKGFTISLEGKEIKDKVKSLEECEKWIDGKLKQKFKRVDVLAKENWGQKLVKGEATSVVDAEYVWFIESAGGKRGKVRVSDVWLFTPANVNRLHDINIANTGIDKLREHIKKIESEAERLTIDMMIEK